MDSDFWQTIKVLAGEALLRRRAILWTFVVISLTMIPVGLYWPKSYSSSADIFVEYRNVIDPLMEGTAVSVDVTDIATNAREILFGRSILRQVLKKSESVQQDSKASALKAQQDSKTSALNPQQDSKISELNPQQDSKTSALNPQQDSKTSALNQEWRFEGLKSRTTLSNIGKNLIRIEYRDEDSEQAYRITKIMAEILVQEMLSAKTRESKAAFDFIDSQVKEYEQILIGIHNQMSELRARNPDADPGLFDQVKTQIDNLVTHIASIEQELKDAEITRNLLEDQLASEAKAISSPADSYRRRIAELQEQLATLRLDYKETYPDIVQIKEQIANLSEGARHRNQLTEKSAASGPLRGGRNTGADTVYQTLKQRLYDIDIQIRTLKPRLAAANSKLDAEEAQLRNMEEAKGFLDSLTQTYKLNDSVYRDLLQRRERARVSLSLDTQQEAVTVRIAEPAFVPQDLSAERLLMFAAGGVALGIVVPVGLLFGFVTVDPRIRIPAILDRDIQFPMLGDTNRLPMLGTIPHLSTAKEQRRSHRGMFWSSVMIVLTLATIGYILALQYGWTTR